MEKLGDRCKRYEMAEAGRKAMAGLPLLARLDGRAFHTFTRGLSRPFCSPFASCMFETARALVEEFDARVGYTQSDEITLLFYAEPGSKAQLPFDGRFQKLTSVLASYAAAVFGREVLRLLPEKREAIPAFDCRVWNVPTLEDALDVFVWREDDAVKNSIAMAAQSVYSTRELHGKNGKEMQEMLFQKGINWNDYPPHFKRGAYVQRKTECRRLTAAELEKIPEAHRPPADQEFLRSRVDLLPLEPIRKVPNAIQILFGVEPGA